MLLTNTCNINRSLIGKCSFKKNSAKAINKQIYNCSPICAFINHLFKQNKIKINLYSLTDLKCLKNKSTWVLILICMVIGLYILTKTVLKQDLKKLNNISYYRKMHKIKNFSQIKTLPITFKIMPKTLVLDYHIQLLHNIILLGKNHPKLTEKIVVNFLQEQLKVIPEISILKTNINGLLSKLRINPKKYQCDYAKIIIERGMSTENVSNILIELETLLNFPLNVMKIKYLEPNILDESLKQNWCNQKNPDVSLTLENSKSPIFYDIKNYNTGKNNCNTIIHLTLYKKENNLICENYLNNYTLIGLLSTAKNQFNYLTQNLNKFNLLDQKIILKGDFLLKCTEKTFNLENFLNFQNFMVLTLQPLLYENYKITMFNMIICFNIIDSPITVEPLIKHNITTKIDFYKNMRPLNDYIVQELEKKIFRENILNKKFLEKGSPFKLNLSDDIITYPIMQQKSQINKKYKDFWDLVSVSESIRLLQEKINTLP